VQVLGLDPTLAEAFDTTWAGCRLVTRCGFVPATVLADRVGPAIPPGHLAAFRVVMDTGMILGPVVLGALAGLAGKRWAVGVAGLLLVGAAHLLGRRGPSLVR
jgi:hypothetical protein